MSDVFTHQGRSYEWCGGFGAMFKSFERGREPGDVRMMHERLFVVFQVRSRGWLRAPEVWWTLPKATAEDLNTCKAMMFRVHEFRGPSVAPEGQK